MNPSGKLLSKQSLIRIINFFKLVRKRDANPRFSIHYALFVGSNRRRSGTSASKLSADAVEFVPLIEKRIVLIDGKTLTNLMIDHNLGVVTKRVVEIKSIDSDYFNED